MIRVERHVLSNLFDRYLGVFVTPHRVGAFMPRHLQAEIAGIALVGAITGVVGAGEILLVDVLSRHVVHRRVVGLQQHQGPRRGGHLNAMKFYQQTARLLGDGDDRARTGAFHGKRSS
ncbi:hypothetical protein D3C80_1015930 [compost metagenome]